MVSTTTVPTDRAALMRQLIVAFVNGDDATTVELVTEDVVGWSPALFVTSRKELLDVFTERHDAFTDVLVDVDALDVVGDKAVAEWRVSANFSGPFELGEATLEPTGRRVFVAGASFCEFDGNQVCSFRHYFDDAAILEQLLQLG